MSDDAVKERLDKHGELLQKIGDQVSSHEAEIVEVKTRMTTVEEDVGELKHLMSSVTSTLHRIEVSSAQSMGEIKLALAHNMQKALDSVPAAFAKRRDFIMAAGILLATIGTPFLVAWLIR